MDLPLPRFDGTDGYVFFQVALARDDLTKPPPLGFGPMLQKWETRRRGVAGRRIRPGRKKRAPIFQHEGTAGIY